MNSIHRVLVVGAGWTGRQIAAQSAAFGVRTYLTDARRETLDAALQWVGPHAAMVVEQGGWPASAVESCGTCLEPIGLEQLGQLSDVDLVIECVPEQISVKRRALRELSQLYPASTLIVSNSSYFTPSMLARYVEHPQRFAHLHFHHPIWRSTVVDIVLGPSAPAEVAETLRNYADRIGQTPIVEAVENPGYVFNWMLQATLKSALDLAERKVASLEEIDLAWKKVTGMALGPFGIMDEIGIDLIYQVLSNAKWVDRSDETQRLLDFLQPWIDRQHHGVKSGRGFYDYSSQKRIGNG